MGRAGLVVDASAEQRQRGDVRRLDNDQLRVGQLEQDRVQVARDGHAQVQT